MADSPFRIGLIGFGNIGSGFVRHLIQFGDHVSRVAGRPVELAAIADREFERPRNVIPPETVKLSTNWREVVTDPNIHMIVELVGVGADGKPNLAFEIAAETMRQGKAFTTANKALIATHGAELHQLEKQHGGQLYYEATVGAGTPMIAPLQTTLNPSRLTDVHGILNGTTNYILARMEEDPALSLQDAIAEAQHFGYAEPDPTSDVEGEDAVYKIVILASLAFGVRLRTTDVLRQGITRLSNLDIKVGKDNGWSLKLLASATRNEKDEVLARVRPVFVPNDHIVASVRSVYNAMMVDGVPVGPVLVNGQGAGQPSTGSGLVADCIVAARHQGQPNPYPLVIPEEPAKAIPLGEVTGRHYLRIPISSEEERGKFADLVPGSEIIESGADFVCLLTGVLSEADMDNTLGKLGAAGVSSDSVTHVRFAFIEGF